MNSIEKCLHDIVQIKTYFLDELFVLFQIYRKELLVNLMSNRLCDVSFFFVGILKVVRVNPCCTFVKEYDMNLI